MVPPYKIAKKVRHTYTIAGLCTHKNDVMEEVLVQVYNGIICIFNAIINTCGSETKIRAREPVIYVQIPKFEL